MSGTDILIDGCTPTLDDLTYLALVNYGAYTSFRVDRDGVRGLDLHLNRLETAALELFGQTPGPDLLRDRMRAGLGQREACWMRVSLFSPEIWARTPSWRGMPQVMTVTSSLPPPLAASVRLQTQTYAREVPHLKHTAIFGLIRARRQARDDGFDDALFVNAQGHVSEGSLWNIGFLDGDAVVWPQAPMLAGVTQALISRGLATVGLNQVVRTVTLDDLSGFDAAFLCNSATPACPVVSIDGVAFTPAPDRIARVETAWRACLPTLI